MSVTSNQNNYPCYYSDTDSNTKSPSSSDHEEQTLNFTLNSTLDDGSENIDLSFPKQANEIPVKRHSDKVLDTFLNLSTITENESETGKLTESELKEVGDLAELSEGTRELLNGPSRESFSEQEQGGNVC